MRGSGRFNFFSPPKSSSAKVNYDAIGTVQTGVGTSVSTSPPSGTNDGFILVLVLQTNTVAAPSTPSGWNYIGATSGWFGGVKAYSWWRLGTDGAWDTPTLTLASSQNWQTAMVRVTGANTTAPVDTFYSTGTPNGGDPVTIGDVSVANNGSLSIAFGGQQSSAANAMTSPASGYTVHAGSTALQSSFFVASKEVDAGTTGGGTWDWPGVTRPVIQYIIIKP